MINQYLKNNHMLMLNIVTCITLSVVSIKNVYSQDDTIIDQNTTSQEFIANDVPVKIKKTIITTSPPLKILATDYMIASVNTLAVQAGAKVLQNGGNAIDALIACQMMLNLVEPQSSSLDGEAIAIYYDATSKKLISYDGLSHERRVSAQTNLNKSSSNQSNSSQEYPNNYATPSLALLLDLLYEKYASQSIFELLKPSIEASLNGFEISTRLAQSIQRLKKSKISLDDSVHKIFFPENKALIKGEKMLNQDFVLSLDMIAQHGFKSYYDQNFIDKIGTPQSKANKPTFDDINNYTIQQQNASCYSFRDYQICGIDKDNAGFLHIMQILKLIENNYTEKDIQQLKTNNKIADKHDPKKTQSIEDYWDLFSNVAGALNSQDNQKVVDIHEPSTSKDIDEPNNIDKSQKIKRHPSNTDRHKFTDNFNSAHIMIKDKFGNMIMMLSTLNEEFGNKKMAGGYFLNGLGDKNLVRQKNATPHQNLTDFIAPIIVLKDSKPMMLLASSNSHQNIQKIAKLLIKHIDFGESIELAINDQTNELTSPETQAVLFKETSDNVKQTLTSNTNFLKPSLYNDTNYLQIIELKNSPQGRSKLIGITNLQSKGFVLGDNDKE